jgi:hypothetical protein
VALFDPLFDASCMIVMLGVARQWRDFILFIILYIANTASVLLLEIRGVKLNAGKALEHLGYRSV